RLRLVAQGSSRSWAAYLLRNTGRTWLDRWRCNDRCTRRLIAFDHLTEATLQGQSARTKHAFGIVDQKRLPEHVVHVVYHHHAKLLEHILWNVLEVLLVL